MKDETEFDIRDHFKGLTKEELDFFRPVEEKKESAWDTVSKLASSFNPSLESSIMLKPALMNAVKIKRGLFIQGRCGNGKTSFIQALLQKARSENINPVSCDCWSDASIISACNSIYNTTTLAIIDDLGVDKPSMEFGTQKDYGAALVQRLYGCKCPFVMSTNLDATGIQARYGERIFDRLKEMCCIYDHALPSFRKSVVL